MLALDKAEDILVSFRPLVPGHVDMYVNIVSVETKELVQSVLVSATAETPNVSETYEVSGTLFTLNTLTEVSLV